MKKHGAVRRGLHLSGCLLALVITAISLFVLVRSLFEKNLQKPAQMTRVFAFSLLMGLFWFLFGLGVGHWKDRRRRRHRHRRL